MSSILAEQEAPSYMRPNAGGRKGVAGSQPMSSAVHRSPNKLWRSHSMFNLCIIPNAVDWLALLSHSTTLPPSRTILPLSFPPTHLGKVKVIFFGFYLPDVFVTLPAGGRGAEPFEHSLSTLGFVPYTSFLARSPSPSRPKSTLPSFQCGLKNNF